MDILKKLNEIEFDDDYTNKQKSIAKFMVNNYIKICFLNLATICEECGCTEVTFLNFCKKIGFDGFADLKNNLRYDIEEKSNIVSYKTNQYTHSILEEEFYKNILKTEIDYINSLYDSIDIQNIISISRKIISSRYVIIIGHDWSYTVGRFLKERLSSLNLSVLLLSPHETSNTEYILNSLDSDDYPIFFSFPEYYYETARIGKSLYNKNIEFLLITDSDNSPASKYTNNKIMCKTHSELFNNTWITPLSLVNIISNMVAVIIKNKKGYANGNR